MSLNQILPWTWRRYIVAVALIAVAASLRIWPLQALVYTPIVAVTSYAMAGDRERALAAGCNGYIEKPINPDTFLAEVLVYLASDLPALAG